MNRSKRVASGLMVALGIAVATQLWAYPEVARQTRAACATCHVNAAGGVDLSDAGKAFKADGKAPAAGAAKTAEYVGANKCRMCHIKQHKAWLGTPHAKAWAGLAKGDSTKSAEIAAALKVEIKGSPAGTDECVRCHVTGFQLASGYPQADSTKAANLANVTCEACHGPGSLHVSAPMAEKKKFTYKATANMCTQCHTPAMSPKFDFEVAKKGVHAVAAAAK
ncbi:MAG: cytochrome c family protein [Candidatus Eisenbacteria bacterium]